MISTAPTVRVLPRGDRRVALDCAIALGTKRMKCPRPIFTRDAVGKVAVVYDQGEKLAGFQQPLTTLVEDFISPNEIVLRDRAKGNSPMCSRFAWGTDYTHQFDQILVALAAEGGGGLVFDGGYLVRGLVLDRSIPSSSRPAFNGIWLRGTSRDTAALEQFDVNVDGLGPHRALIALGYGAEHPGQDPANDWLRGIAISDLELRQLPNTTKPCAIIASYAAKNCSWYNLRAIGGSYEGLVWGGHSTGLSIYNIVIEGAGLGGPSRAFSDSGFNALGHEIDAHDMTILGCGQGIEISSHRSKYQRISIDRNGAQASPSIGVNIGSSSQGIWENELTDLTVRDYPAAFSISNVNGTANRTRIIRARIHNGSILVKSGLHQNDPSVAVLDSVGRDSIVHGQTIIQDPQFSYDENGGVPASPFIFGQRGFPADGLEDVLVEGATVNLPKHQWCVGGSNDGKAALSPGDCPAGHPELLTAFACFSDYGASQRVPLDSEIALGTPWRPGKDNGRYYLVVQAGHTGTKEPTYPTAKGSRVDHGTAVLECRGSIPRVLFVSSRVHGPPSATDTGSFRLDFGVTFSDVVELQDHVQSFDWKIFYASGEGRPQVKVRAMTSYSSREPKRF